MNDSNELAVFFTGFAVGIFVLAWVDYNSNVTPYEHELIEQCESVNQKLVSYDLGDIQCTNGVSLKRK